MPLGILPPEKKQNFKELIFLKPEEITLDSPKVRLKFSIPRSSQFLRELTDYLVERGFIEQVEEKAIDCINFKCYKVTMEAADYIYDEFINP